ncbi:hypothetical protein JQ597_04480 [Bradyrhizobium sp. AUGA SZCCT0177]|uniref:hypothetical protein n=1 Tax=Bradyrhizobium sp. AUGA SZCCT0177 TaxID=2807665 RepID=UPI001BAC1B70|nr:hypothetical protein [Bradyrhizobium sp. AUGA SZCCT0177]MBR1281291.1 hypothetical protein [Bradyrhizobium sp. AUGA SZCCT0177]
METLANCLKRIFPKRTEEEQPYYAWPGIDGSRGADYATPPMIPADVFAAAGYVLQYSGAYHHVIADVPGRSGRAARQIKVDGDFISRARRISAVWRTFTPISHFSAKDPNVFAKWLATDGEGLKDLYEAWNAVWSVAGPRNVFEFIPAKSVPPDWWWDALLLMMAADEAAKDMGFVRYKPSAEGNSQPWFFAPVEQTFFAAAARTMEQAVQSKGPTRMPYLSYSPVSTISVASPDVVAVLPKARTTAVGCTLRSMSHHLALLPPRGIARAAWTPYLFADAPPDERHMNLLLIPFPFTIPASAFEPQHGYAGEGGKRWAFFGVEQTWLQDVTKDKLLDFVKALAGEAKSEADAIHGIVFPELALDEGTWDHLRSELPEALPELELFVAGVSGDGDREGNFVRVAVFQRSNGSGGSDDTAERVGFWSTREKHHRWTLDRDEVLAYGLEGRLSPSISWAEDIDLLSRRVDFAVIRQSSVISAMICEDLARVDPCQELIRAIGPSIVFALLMDAPQLKARWPARYATILAEDPGSAVLTLTSRGLMTRQHRIGKHPSKKPDDRIIALWRDDDRTDPIEIACPMNCHAVRLTLSGVPVVDRTLDGREDRSAVAWRYANHAPVCLKDVTSKYSDVLGQDDLALQAANRTA